MQPSQEPRPVPAKNAGTRTGQPLDLNILIGKDGPAPVEVVTLNLHRVLLSVLP